MIFTLWFDRAISTAMEFIVIANSPIFRPISISLNMITIVINFSGTPGLASCYVAKIVSTRIVRFVV